MTRNPVAAMLIALATTLPAQAQQVETSRARIEPARMEIRTEPTRQCWARYGTAPRNGQSLIEEVAFRVPCPEQITPDFVRVLQRALHARGHYSGEITGRADDATRAAVQDFQRRHGFNSPILTLETAVSLGLVPIEVTRN
jgi:hypothetical protein